MSADSDADVGSDFDEDDLPEPCRQALNRITSHVTEPGKMVFVEETNTDGWISTDTTVEVSE
ncbi:MAG: hypothetical protein SV760_06525 [Halobacteria archaeon]|nr:hypothetical protein [Halobacteria archaeon]